MGRVAVRVSAVAFCLGLVSAIPARAQDAGIAGVVRDNTGGVVPGVTVTATSPALIEQQRVVTTDGEGRYSITQLRPGTYSVTFNLQGFSSIVREGLQLSAGFTANVDAELRPGALEETITVTGATPVVDVSNVRRQTVVTDELLEALPTSTKSVGTFLALTLGMTGVGEVGGSYQAEPGLDGAGGGKFHGKFGHKVSFDGMGMENSSGNSSYQLNAASVQEMVMSTSGMSAESSADGLVVNVIPKEGGNTFSTVLAGLFANDSLESSNLSQRLRDRGLQTGNKTIKLFDASASVGGPIKKDRLWFFAAPRTWGLSRGQAGTYWNKTQNEFLTPPGAALKVVKWTPWIDRPESRDSGRLEWYDSILGRITWQATEKNKFNVTYDEQRACNCGSFSAADSHESYIGQYRFEPNRLFQTTWSAPVTSRLLLEAGYAATISQWNMYYIPGVTDDIVHVNDLGLGITYGAPFYFLGHPNGRDRYTQRASLSYVTGSHNIKTGFQNEQLATDTYYHANGDLAYYFLNGTPIGFIQIATPYLQQSRAKWDLGIYAQDQWAVTNKLTLNLGVRYEYFNSYVPAQRAGFAEDTDGYWGSPTVNPWLGQRTFEAKYNIPNWHDINPRLGAAYDLFGNGRTALKFSVGRYVGKVGTDVAEASNPIVTGAWNSGFRAWVDSNRNYVIDCNLASGSLQVVPGGDFCGAADPDFYSGNNPNATEWDRSVTEGWAKRDHNWDFSTEIQQELRSNVALTAGWYHNTGGYFRAGIGITDNQSASRKRVVNNLGVTSADYDTYCFTAPSDARLPGGGGYQICDLADIKPTKYADLLAAKQLVTAREPFGDYQSYNDFFNITLNARLPRNITLGGGFDTGRSYFNSCFVVDSPQALLNCEITIPFKAQTQMKAHGIFPFPGDIVASFAFQNFSGPQITASYSATPAQIAASTLGRAPASAGNLTIPLIKPQTMFEDRITRLDLRLSKIIRIKKLRVQANLDAYNVLNSGGIRSIISQFGPRWRNASQILDPRLIQLGGQISF